MLGKNIPKYVLTNNTNLKICLASDLFFIQFPFNIRTKDIEA